MESSFQEQIKSHIFKIATRNSALALSQTNEVIDQLVNIQQLGLKKENFELVQITNAIGDKNLKDPLYLLGGTGVFTKQVENELLNKNADIAVHSLKDLPTQIDPQLVIASIPELQPRGDVIIVNQKHKNKTLDQFEPDSIIGTSSLRRIANLKSRYPKLKFENIRGNLNTRLKKLQEGQYDAIILAQAGVHRLGWDNQINQFLDEKVYLYAPGQGALGIQCRSDDQLTIHLLSFLDQKLVRIRVEAERQFLNKLEGGCKLPIAVYSEITKENKLLLIGQVWNLDGSKTVRQDILAELNDNEVGLKLSNIMKEKGAIEILDDVKKKL